MNECFWLRRLLPALVAATALLAGAPEARAGGEIYGTIRTKEGQTLRGPIRWDRNEVFWGDLLNAVRREAIKKEEDDREFKMSIFGMRVGGQPDEFTRHAFSIPFGHLRSLEPVSGQEARLSLKNGTEMVVLGGSTDIGPRMRELVIDDTEQGPVTLNWQSIKKVEFAQGPGAGRDAERLYGKVATADGTVEGFIVFDADLALASDMLSGTHQRDKKEIRLGDVSRLEPAGGSSAAVTLGPQHPAIELRDIKGRRTVSVQMIGVGTVEIDWDDIEQIDFAEPKKSPRYDTFDGGRRLAGTVHTPAGKALKGEIVWDRDEIYTFDKLDGEVGDLDYSIPFANIRTIKRKSSEVAQIVFVGGSTVELSGTNDVNDENRGIIVHLASGIERELDWNEIDRVEFQGASKQPLGGE